MFYITTREDYRNWIKRKLKLSLVPDNGEWSDDYLNEVIEEARQQLWDRAGANKDGVVYVDSVIDQEDYDISDLGIDVIKKIRYNDGVTKFRMYFASLNKYLRLTQTEESGTPYRWTKEKITLKVYPRPSGEFTNAFEIYCRKTLTALSADSDIDTDIQTRYKHLIGRLALAIAWLEAEQEDNANIHFAKYERDFSRIEFDMNRETIGENVGGEIDGTENEIDERHFSTPIG